MSGAIQSGETEIHSNKPGKTKVLGKLKRYTNQVKTKLLSSFSKHAFEKRLGRFKRNVKTVVVQDAGGKGPKSQGTNVGESFQSTNCS